MSKKTLLISSSPRCEGNSDILCDEFLRGAQEAGHTGEKIRLADKEIHYCTGCCACIQRPGFCAQQDEMAELREKLLACDVLVLATPVYFHALNGPMKNFIDRVCPIYTELKNKEVYFVIAAAGGAAVVESTAQSLRLFTDCFDSFREKGVISVTGVWGEGEVKRTSAIQHAYQAGRAA
ncbi:MAG: NADPH-dependent FMN reductase [Desulfuromonas sp.]|nr:MAG: NADPH-dependent FMN reductase [Desulfuromonas sp.]